MPTVSGKTLGKKSRHFEDFSVNLSEFIESGQTVTLRRILTAIVLEQIDQFESRQRDNQFIRFLTPTAIAESERTGKLTFGDSEIEPQTVNRSVAIENAELSFADGLYWVIIDGEQLKNLDDTKSIHEDSKIVFLRLTMIVGG